MPSRSPLPPGDLAIILLYLLAMLAVGIWFARRSSQRLAAYFLGDRKMSWWALALSGRRQTRLPQDAQSADALE